MSGTTSDYGHVIRRTDGSYVINDGMFHVPNDGEYVDLWAEVDAYATKHPTCVTTEIPNQPTLEDQLAAIEVKYASKIASLREAIMSAYLTDGETMDSNVAGLRAEWADVIVQRNAEMEALLI